MPEWLAHRMTGVLPAPGLWVSLSHRGAARSEWIRYSLLQLLLMPWYTAVEAFAVIHAVFRPPKGFYVVEK